MATQTAKLNYLHIAPRKVRLIASTLKGLPVQEAEAQLLLRPQRAAKPLLKLLRSAVAGAKNNQKLTETNLVVQSINVDQGPMLKRSLPRAMGRATPIHKKMSHVTLVLSDLGKAVQPRFVITPPPKKEKKVTGKKEGKAKKTELKSERPKEKSGFLRKFFRRKAV